MKQNSISRFPVSRSEEHPLPPSASLFAI